MLFLLADDKSWCSGWLIVSMYMSCALWIPEHLLAESLDDSVVPQAETGWRSSTVHRSLSSALILTGVWTREAGGESCSCSCSCRWQNLFFSHYSPTSPQPSQYWLNLVSDDLNSSRSDSILSLPTVWTRPTRHNHHIGAQQELHINKLVVALSCSAETNASNTNALIAVLIKCPISQHLLNYSSATCDDISCVLEQTKA